MTLFLELLSVVGETDEQHPMIWNVLAEAVSKVLCRSISMPWRARLLRFLQRCHRNVQVPWLSSCPSSITFRTPPPPILHFG